MFTEDPVLWFIGTLFKRGYKEAFAKYWGMRAFFDCEPRKRSNGDHRASVGHPTPNGIGNHSLQHDKGTADDACADRRMRAGDANAL